MGFAWGSPLLFTSNRTLITVSTARRSALVNPCFGRGSGFVVVVTGAVGFTVEVVEEAVEVESPPSR